MKGLRASQKIMLVLFNVIFLSLGSVGCSLAWFLATKDVSTESSGFRVYASSSEIDSLALYKFNYPTNVVAGDDGDDFTYTDYLSPENGYVGKYDFDNEQRKFGSYESGDFHSVETMNRYDPVEKWISQTTLRDLNVNTIYEVVLSTTSAGTAGLSISANRHDVGDTTNKIKASDCFDFDIFFESDLADPAVASLPVNAGQLTQYPSYKDTNFNDKDSVYYKLSFLSDQKAGHTHFYPDAGNAEAPQSISLYNDTATFKADGSIRIFINVNYASDRLTQYETNLNLDSIPVVVDYSFSFNITEGAA